MKKIAIIPARSGSKGLVDKNIKTLANKPLMAWTIEAAIRSKKFDIIHVSTDSIKYAEIAKQYGADVPFLREEAYSTDTATTWDTVKYVLSKYKSIGQEFEIVTVLQPTSPLRDETDIINALDIMKDKKLNAVVSVTEVEHSPLWCNTLPENLNMASFIKPEIVGIPRQNLEKYYRINGAIYNVKVEYLYSCNSIYETKCEAYIMNQKQSIDIDSDIDFKIAECLCSI